MLHPRVEGALCYQTAPQSRQPSLMPASSRLEKFF